MIAWSGYLEPQREALYAHQDLPDYVTTFTVSKERPTRMDPDVLTQPLLEICNHEDLDIPECGLYGSTVLAYSYFRRFESALLS